jgi:hypothetical protein
MNVLEFIATADPMLSKTPITVELHDIDLVAPHENSLHEFPVAKTFVVRRAVLVAAAVALIASFGIFLPRETGPITYDWSAPVISPATATVNLSKQFAQQTRLNPGETLFVIHESSTFNADGALVDVTRTKSWRATNWASVEYLQRLTVEGVEVAPEKLMWSEISRMSGSDPDELNDFSIGFSPIWERSVPYNDPQAMYRKLVEQSQTFNSSWLSGSEWIAGALQALISSETSAPGQRVMAIALSNALFEQGITNQLWTETRVGGRVMWSRSVDNSSEIELTVIDPEIPGVRAAAKYRLDELGQRGVTFEHRVVSWAVVGDLDEQPASEALRTVPKIDVSKL